MSMDDGNPDVLGAMRRLLNSCSNLTQPDLSGWAVTNLSKIRNLETNFAGVPGQQQFFYTTRNNIDQPQMVDDSKLPQFGQP